MREIIKYSNRKLYDKQERRYLTLPEIREFLLEGQEIRVMSQESKENGKYTVETTKETLGSIVGISAEFYTKEELVDFIRKGVRHEQ